MRVLGSWGVAHSRGPRPAFLQCVWRGEGGCTEGERLVPSLAIDPGESPAQRVPVTREGDRRWKDPEKRAETGNYRHGVSRLEEKGDSQDEGMEPITPCLKPAMSPRCHAQPPPPAWSTPFHHFLPSQAPAFALELFPPAMFFPRLVSLHPQRGPP